jgi:hypothetical protein
MLSQQIKNYNKKIASSSFNFIPNKPQKVLNNQNYSIPHNSSKHFNYQQAPPFQPEPPSSHNDHPNSSSQFQPFPDVNIKRAPAPPPPGPQDFQDPNPSDFSAPQRFSSFSQQPLTFEGQDVGSREENTHSRNENQERPMPPIAFQQLEGHVYRSQKKSSGKKDISQVKGQENKGYSKVVKVKPPVPNKGLNTKGTVQGQGISNKELLQKRSNIKFKPEVPEKRIKEGVLVDSKEVSEMAKINGNCQKMLNC